MRRLSTYLLALTVLSSPAVAHAESLSTMLGKVVGDHPRIEAAKSALASAKAKKEEAFSGYLPKIDITAGGGYEHVDRTDLTPAGAKTNESTTSYTASITENLFEGFRTQAAVASANAGSEVAKFGLSSTEQQVLFEGASAYIEVLRFVELTQLATSNQENLREQLHLEDERVKRGSGIAVDALQAKSRLQISKERYTAFMGGLKDAISRYAQVFNEMPDLDHMQLPELPIHVIPATMDEAIAAALTNNPLLASTKSGVAVAQHARTTAEGGYYPTVDLIGASSIDEDAGGIEGEEIDNSVKVQSSWQVFSGFADRARVRQASHNYQSAVDNATYTERKIAEEVKLAWSSVTTTKERADLLDNAVNIAGEVYDARKRLRDAGSETALNVLDAENELYSARIDAASARYDYYLSVYRLLTAMGAFTLENATAT